MSDKDGSETRFRELLCQLLAMEQNAVAAYEKTIGELSTARYRQKIANFKADHERHLQELTELANIVGLGDRACNDHHRKPAQIQPAQEIEDSAVLLAIRAEEVDVLAAYERACSHTDASSAAQAVFKRAYSDEVKHLEWMSDAAAQG